MPQITVRDIPEEINQAIGAEAEKRGQSKEAYLRDVLKQAAQPMQPIAFSNEEISKKVYERTQMYEGWSLEQQAWVLQTQMESDLARYFLLLDETLRSLQFSENEALMMCDICNGTLWQLEGFALTSLPVILNAEIHDGIKLGQTDKKWNVDGKQFLARVRKFTPLEALAIIDAIERFWKDGTYQIDSKEKVRQVGLVRDEKSPLQPE